MCGRDMQIKRLEPIHPAYQAFLDGLKSGALDRAGAVNEAARLSGVTVHDVGNTSMGDLTFSLMTLINRTLSNMPDTAGCKPNDIKHIIIGHAGGSGDNWFFLGNAGRVGDYVNAHVPAGQKAWVLACETGQRRFFNILEGREVISAGQQMDRPR